MAVDEEALLEEIGRDPDDERAYLVYADWLQARGDPRGELISIQQALRAGGQDSERVHQQRVLQDNFLRGHEEYFLEGLLERTENCVVPAGWRFGFIERVLMMTRPDGPTVEAMAETLFALKSARFVRDMLLVGDDLDDLFEWLEDMRTWKYARALDIESSGTLLSLHLLSTAAPTLSRLSIRANESSLGGLATSRWPALTSLTMSFSRWERDSSTLLAPMFAADRTPALRHVSLPNHVTAQDEPMIAIAQSGLLERLESLELSNSSFSATTTRLLGPHRARLKELKIKLRGR